ncbi:PoNe immunity protein domain-containing protein [Vibrio caribbeanicus]|uniref:PoNe immunity protein domain-containing protein n=1 Tax=Vibrio caribbeanicus TaxID=701175 RepID=UPI0030D83150
MNEQALKFAQTRREPLLEREEYEEQYEFFTGKSPLYGALKDETKTKPHRARISWSLTLDRFEYTLLVYSGGDPMIKTLELSELALKELDRHKSDFPHKTYLFWEPDSFQFLLWCLSFVALTGKTEYLSTIVRMYGTSPEVSGEACMAQLFRLFNVHGIPDSAEEELVFPKSYQHLYNAIKTGPLEPSKKEREESVKAYLRGWYKGMKDCYWYGRHKRPVANFFGYWALEAAMVTLLFDLDDSSYSHLPYYPKDWLEEARRQGYDQLIQTENLPSIQLAFPQTPCPETGSWQSNLTSEVLSLKEGELMPGPLQDDNETAYFWIMQTS